MISKEEMINEEIEYLKEVRLHIINKVLSDISSEIIDDLRIL